MRCEKLAKTVCVKFRNARQETAKDRMLQQTFLGRRTENFYPFRCQQDTALKIKYFLVAWALYLVFILLVHHWFPVVLVLSYYSSATRSGTVTRTTKSHLCSLWQCRRVRKRFDCEFNFRVLDSFRATSLVETWENQFMTFSRLSLWFIPLHDPGPWTRQAEAV